MAGESDKQVKLQFVVDQASVQAAKKAMGELIVEATKLANVLKSASLGGGGSVLGGGGVGAGSLNPQQTIAKNAASGPSGGISGGATEAAKSIVLMGRNTKDAYRGCTDAVTRNLNDQGRDVDAFSRKVAALNQELAALRQNSGGGGGGTGGLVDQFGRPMGGGGAATGVGAGIMGGGGGGGGPPSGTTAAVEAAAGGAAGGAAGMSPSLMRGLKIGAIAAAAYKAVSAGQQVFEFESTLPMRPQQLTAQRADIWGGQYRAARSGDLSTALAALGAGGVNLGRGMHGAPNDVGSIVEQLGDRTGAIKGANLMKAAKSFLKLDIGGIGNTATDILHGNWGNLADTQTQKNMAEAMENFLKTNPQAVAALGQFQSEAGGQRGLQRALGLGGHISGKGANWATLGRGAAGMPGGGGRYTDQARALQAQVEGMGYDVSEYASALSPLRQSLGTSAAVRSLAFSVMGGEAGGFAGIGGIASAAGVGGSPQDFIRAIYGRGPTGRMNQAAAMGVGGAVAGLTSAGGFATSGLGTLGAFQAGLGEGTGGYQDLLMGQQARAGLGAFGAVMGGGLDKYQSAMNFLTAGQAFGNVGFGAQGVISEVFGKNPSLAADIMAGGAIPPELRALGVTSKEQVAQYVKETSKGVIARATNVMGNETSAGRLINSIQAGGGDIQEYMKSQGIHGASLNKKGKRIGASKGFDEFRHDLAAGLMVSQGLDADAAEGEAALLMGVGAKGVHKGGAGAPESAERQALKDLAAMTRKNTKELEDMAELSSRTQPSHAVSSGCFWDSRHEPQPQRRDPWEGLPSPREGRNRRSSGDGIPEGPKGCTVIPQCVQEQRRCHEGRF